MGFLRQGNYLEPNNRLCIPYIGEQNTTDKAGEEDQRNIESIITVEEGRIRVNNKGLFWVYGEALPINEVRLLETIGEWMTRKGKKVSQYSVYGKMLKKAKEKRAAIRKEVFKKIVEKLENAESSNKQSGESSPGDQPAQPSS
ncbi:hypothetical protein HY501_00565 [Candidatus Woesearchaeota archaeon]|nr:hypothetical protein [Candidatus Woesearchaeota archaeon]